MSQQLLIDGSRPDQTQFALIGDNGLDDFEYESKLKKNQKGNIYLGKVSRIEASLQATFVDIGNERNAFLAFGEIHPNYFQIPIADRDALIAAESEIEEIHNEEKHYEEEVNGNIVDSLVYDDADPWPLEADGMGPTLELIHPSLDNAFGTNWSASNINGGTPGVINSVYSTDNLNNIGSGIVINEINYNAAD